MKDLMYDDSMNPSNLPICSGKLFKLCVGHLKYSNADYVGALKNNIPHGYGKIIYSGESAGQEYLGQWNNGEPTWQGTYSSADDPSRKNDKHHLLHDNSLNPSNLPICSGIALTLCFGHLMYSNADYVGALKNNIPHGYGKIIYSGESAGQEYLGQWKNGEIHGQGKFTFSDSYTEEGIYVDGIFNNGIRTTLTSNGEMIKGVFVDGKLQGFADPDSDSLSNVESDSSKTILVILIIFSLVVLLWVFRERVNSFMTKYDFVRDELKDLPQFSHLPKGKINNFTSRIKYALLLGIKEKEIFFFGLIQWVSVVLAYLLWLQMIYWIPQSVWDYISECIGSGRDYCSLRADIPLFLWGVVCILLAAFPVGILSLAMGTTHFLHKNNEQSTVIKCLNAAFSNAFATWNFHFVDGLITVNRIIDRIPGGEDRRTVAEIAASEALYYAWKLGNAGVIPSLVLGDGIIESGKNSIKFVKANFLEIVKLRSAYSLLCWITGLLAYIGAILTFYFMGDDVYAISGGLAISKIYLFLVFPIGIAVSIVMIFLRPIYVLTLCDMYSDFLALTNEEAKLPLDPENGKKAIIVFILVCLIVALVIGLRDQLGLTRLLSQFSEISYG